MSGKKKIFQFVLAANKLASSPVKRLKRGPKSRPEMSLGRCCVVGATGQTGSVNPCPFAKLLIAFLLFSLRAPVGFTGLSDSRELDGLLLLAPLVIYRYEVILNSGRTISPVACADMRSL